MLMPHGLSSDQLATLRGESGSRGRRNMENVIAAKVHGEHRGLSLTASMKAAPALGSSPYAVYVASQTAAIKERKKSGELGPGGVLRAAAPVLDALSKIDDQEEIKDDADLNEALKELHQLLAGEDGSEGTSDDSNGSSGGDSGDEKKVEKSRKSGDTYQPRSRDPFGNPAPEPSAGAYRGPFGEVIAEKNTDLAEALANDTSDAEDEAEGYDAGGEDFLVRQVRRQSGGLGNSDF